MPKQAKKKKAAMVAVMIGVGGKPSRAAKSKPKKPAPIRKGKQKPTARALERAMPARPAADWLSELGAADEGAPAYAPPDEGANEDAMDTSAEESAQDMMQDEGALDQSTEPNAPPTKNAATLEPGEPIKKKKRYARPMKKSEARFMGGL